MVVVLRDWSPVVVVVLLPSDWSPVVVLLSIVRLERPRRSIDGVNVELEPVTDEFTSEVDPVTVEFEVALEPVTDGLLELVAEDEGAAERVVAALEVVTAMPEVELVVALGDEALEGASGMQSVCTGLLELSFALPVALSASLPALGWWRSLQSGLAADVVPAFCACIPDFDLALVFPSAFCVAAVGSFIVLEGLVWAKAGAAPMRAAMARVLRYWERIICCLLSLRN